MKHLIAFFLFSLLLGSCASPYVARLEPKDETSVYRYGEKLVTKADGQAEVTVSYYDSSPKYVVFHLGVKNTGDAPFNFDPATCLLVGDAGPVQQAIDPEVQLLATDLQTIKDIRSNQVFAIASVAASLTGAVLAGTGGVGRADALFYGETALYAAGDLGYVMDGYNPEDEVVRGVITPLNGNEPAPNSRYFWLDYAFRITTINPGQSAFGKIAFERNDAATNLLFKVAVQGKEFTFPFSQKLIHAKDGPAID